MTSTTLASLVSTTALVVLCGTAMAAPDGDWWHESPPYRMDSCDVAVWGQSMLYWGATDETFSDTYSFSTYQGATEAEPFTGSYLHGGMNYYYGNELTMAQSYSWAQSRLISGGFQVAVYSQMKAQTYAFDGSTTTYTRAIARIEATFEVLAPSTLSIITESDRDHQGNNEFHNGVPVNWHRALKKLGPDGSEYLFYQTACVTSESGMFACAGSPFDEIEALELEPGVYVLEVDTDTHDQTRYAPELVNSEGRAYLLMDLLFDHAEKPADLTGDGEVDGADMTQLLAAWGGDDPNADLDSSGLVDGADLVYLLAAWD